MPTRTPEQWRTYLLEQLDRQAREWLMYDRYYTGDHPLPDAPHGARLEYLRLMRLSRANWMQLIVDAVAERLVVDGVRLGNQPLADVDIWQTIWQPNGMDAEHADVHTEALVGGVAGAMVWPAAGSLENAPTITTEHPTQMFVELAGGGRRHRRAGIKRFVEADVEYVAMQLAADESGDSGGAMVYKWRRPMTSNAWEPYADPGDPDAVFVNPLGVVSMVPFHNRRRMIGRGSSELAGGPTDIQDRINETLFGRLSAQRFAAFRQRWVTGLDIPTDPETGRPVEPFKSAVDRIWMVEAGGPNDPEVKFGEFSATDLSPFIKAVESDIQHLAAITRTPPHYLLGQSGAFPSGESLKATETGLVAKVKARQLRFGEAWEDVIRLALGAMGDARAADDTLEVIWRDPEARSLGELVDALTKLKTLNVPDEALWEQFGASPQQINRWRAQAARSQLAAVAATPAAPRPVPAPAPDAAPAAAEVTAGAGTTAAGE